MREGGAMQVLIVEDDDAIAVPFAHGLEREGFGVVRATTGEAALEASGYDLVLLDLGLPDMDGFAVCHELRARSTVPIIVVTARGDEADRVVGLELGADDYLVKPFGFRELVARIRAVARRAVATGRGCRRGADARGAHRRRPHPSGDDRRRGNRADPQGVRPAGVAGRGTRRLFERTTILERVWDPHWYGPTKTLDVHVATLRKKLGDPAWMETVRGVGFRLVDPAAA